MEVAGWVVLVLSASPLVTGGPVITRSVEDDTPINITDPETLAVICPEGSYDLALVQCLNTSITDPTPATDAKGSVQVLTNSSLLALVMCPPETVQARVQCLSRNLVLAMTTNTTTEDSGIIIGDIEIAIIVVLLGLAFILLVLVVTVPPIYYCYRCKKMDECDKFRKERDDARVEQENQEQAHAVKLMKWYLGKYDQPYTYDHNSFKLGYIGCRLQRYWFQVRSKDDGRDLIMTIAPVSMRCAIVLNLNTLRILDQLLKKLKEENSPHVHLVRKIDYVYSAEKETGYAIVVQDTCKSLRDHLHKKAFEETWTQYGETNSPLNIAVVREFGKQILEGLLVLYRQGICPLGHLHSGNIFVRKLDEPVHLSSSGSGEDSCISEQCSVGGYENTLLGYRTKLHSKLLQTRGINMKFIDIYLFGHVLYEMAVGECLEVAVPTRVQWKTVPDELEKVLDYIFNLKKSSKKPEDVIKHILQTNFFKPARPKSNLPDIIVETAKSAKTAISSFSVPKFWKRSRTDEQQSASDEIKTLLSKVRDANPVGQGKEPLYEPEKDQQLIPIHNFGCMN